MFNGEMTEAAPCLHMFAPFPIFPHGFGLHKSISAGPKGDEQFAFGQNWQQFVEGQRISVQGLLSSVREVREMVGGAIQELKPLVNPNGWVSWESQGLR
jgi:hypothetical protein